MDTYPKPDHHIFFTNPNRAIIQADARRVDWFGWMNLLEMQTRVIRVLFEESICLSGLALDLLR